MVVKTAFLKKTYSKPKMETNMALIRDMHPPSSTVTQLAVPGNSWLYLSLPGIAWLYLEISTIWDSRINTISLITFCY